jgi:hypothetical protein
MNNMNGFQMCKYVNRQIDAVDTFLNCMDASELIVELTYQMPENSYPGRQEDLTEKINNMRTSGYFERNYKNRQYYRIYSMRKLKREFKKLKLNLFYEFEKLEKKDLIELLINHEFHLAKKEFLNDHVTKMSMESARNFREWLFNIKTDYECEVWGLEEYDEAMYEFSEEWKSNKHEQLIVYCLYKDEYCKIERAVIEWKNIQNDD